MSLYGCRYIQDADPSGESDFGGAGFEWYSPTTGDLFFRDTTNTTWNAFGNGDSPHLGLAPTTGYTSTGAINGVTGWAPQESPDFTTSAKLGGVDLATVNDLSDLQTTLEELIAAQIASGMAGLSASISLDNSLVFAFGTVADGATVPLPSFSDRQATASEVVAVVPCALHLGGVGSITEVMCSINPATRVASVSTANASGPPISSGTATYLIICKKASS